VFYNKELLNLCSSPNIVRMIKSKMLRWEEKAGLMEETCNAHRILVTNLEWKRPLGRRRRRWEDNIKMDIM
jgi:hypothetical protein